MATEPLQLREWNTGPKIYLGNLGEKADKFKIAELFMLCDRLQDEQNFVNESHFVSFTLVPTARSFLIKQCTEVRFSIFLSGGFTTMQ